LESSQSFRSKFLKLFKQKLTKPREIFSTKGKNNKTKKKKKHTHTHTRLNPLTRQTRALLQRLQLFFNQKAFFTPTMTILLILCLFSPLICRLGQQRESKSYWKTERECENDSGPTEETQKEAFAAVHRRR